MAFPLAALEARSASGFVAGVGLGSASLVRNLSGASMMTMRACITANLSSDMRYLCSRTATHLLSPDVNVASDEDEGSQRAGVTSTK